MKDLQYITNSSPSFIEGLYQDFVKDPQSVDPEFKKFFEGFDFAISQGKNGNGQTDHFQRTGVQNFRWRGLEKRAGGLPAHSGIPE